MKKLIYKSFKIINKILKILLIVLLLFIFTSKCSNAEELKFKLPTSDAENSLNYVLSTFSDIDLSSNEKKSYSELSSSFIKCENITKLKRRDKIQCLNVFTEIFLTTFTMNNILQNAESQSSVSLLNAIIGDQTSNIGYVYKTHFQSDSLAYIQYIWLEQTKQVDNNFIPIVPTSKYIDFKMKKEQGIWKLDGLGCGEDSINNKECIIK